jgi:hypothetical protein
MKQMSVKLSNCIATLMTALLVITVGPTFALAENDGTSPSLKPMAPQLDPSAERKPLRPLQAGIQHNESFGTEKKKTTPMKGSASAAPTPGFIGKLRGGAKTADSDPLRARANNNNNSGFNIQATSGFGIIGVKFVLSEGRPPIINRVFMGTPASQVGLLPNDAIVAVDGVPTSGLSKEEVYDLIIGSPGTRVNISIQRAGDFRVVNCTRMDINDIADPLVRRDYLMSM